MAPNTPSRVSSAALMLCLLVDSSIKTGFAFVSPPPHHGASTFSRATVPSPTFQVDRLGASDQLRGSSTALSANLFDRVMRVAKGNVNNVLKYMEDPEKIMNQAMEDMQTDLVKVRQSYAQITATQRRLMKQKEMSDRLADDWYARAQLALKQGNEGLARAALAQRQGHLETSKGLKAQLDAQGSAIDRLYNGMQELESKILEAKAKKEQMVARARTAKSTQQVNDMLSGLTGKTSMDAFRKMEEKVEALEAAAEVSAEMGMFSLPGTTFKGKRLEEEFKMLESSSEVDAELKRMQRKQLTGSSTSDDTVRKIPISVSGNVDSELQKLKQKVGM